MPIALYWHQCQRDGIYCMNFLYKLNNFYSKYLFWIVPLGTVLVSTLELFLGHNPQYRSFAYIFIAIMALLFFKQYVSSGKENIGYCLIQLIYFFIVLAMSVGTLLHVSNTVWMILSAIVIFDVSFILFFCLQAKKMTEHCSFTSLLGLLY